MPLVVKIYNFSTNELESAPHLITGETFREIETELQNEGFEDVNPLKVLSQATT